MKEQKGKVYLVGAGPGDPGLITVKGRQLLERADIVVYDYLANKKLLRCAPPEAERIYVGKKGHGKHCMTQEEINQILVDQALTGKRVVRLKGGDPFIFGRGGEEIEQIVKHGIDFEVVPGVTSASAAATYAGIPITHRQHTASVAFITGHEDPTKKESSIAWDKLATGIGTIVFYMGIKNLPNIAENLMKHGRSADTPVAVIRWASMPEQRSVVGTLGTIVDIVAQENIRPPAIIVIGDVVQLRDIINWYEKKPLLGKRIMVTRTRDQASDLVASLEELGADCIEFATIALEPPDSWDVLDTALDKVDSYDWILFTSINAIHCFMKRLWTLGRDVRHLHGLKIGVVGKTTEEVLQSYGLRADLLPQKFTGEGLAQSLCELGMEGKRLLLPRAKKASEVLPETLRSAGATVDIAPVYQNVRPKGREEELRGYFLDKAVDVVTFTSSSTFTNFRFMLNAADEAELKSLLSGVKIASIGPVTSSTITKSGLTVDIEPQQYTIPYLVAAIEKEYNPE